MGLLCWGAGGDSHPAEGLQQASQYQVWGRPYSLVCMLAAWLPVHAMALGVPVPAAPTGDSAGDGEHRGPHPPLPPSHGTALALALHTSCSMEDGCGLHAIQESGMVGRSSCVAADSRAKGTVTLVVCGHRRKRCCLGLERCRDAGVLPSWLGLLGRCAPSLGSDGISLSLCISPSLLRIPACV